jgi:ERCC4-type nuclease
MLILDNRETKLIELIKASTEFKIPYTTENLQIGDIIIRHQNTANTQTTYNIILERKCITDMIASIKDGRYKEQKIRLLAEVAKNNNTNQTIIAYILEGSQNELRLPQDKTMLNGSIISSLFRDKIPLIRTYTLQETLNIITRLHERLSKDYTEFFTTNKTTIILETQSKTTDYNFIKEEENITTKEINIANIQTINNNNNNDIINQDNQNNQNNLYLASIKKCKKNNITPKLWNQMCYMNIPGISSNIAIKISEIYPTIKLLLQAYEKCSNEDEKEQLLAKIILTETDTQKRRIGNIVSKRVYQFLLSI